jgi:predicted membrane GTPase involved in stress response
MSNTDRALRNITILAENCTVEYMVMHIDIVDAFGHMDFFGEQALAR